MAVVDRFLWRHGSDASAVFDRGSGATYVLSPLTVAVFEALQPESAVSDATLARSLPKALLADDEAEGLAAIRSARAQLASAGLLS